MPANNIIIQNFSKKINFFFEDDVPVGKKRKKMKKKKYFFASLKLMKKGVGSGVGSGSGSRPGSGSISQSYLSADLEDPDPHQNVTDPQHCHRTSKSTYYSFVHFLGISMRDLLQTFHCLACSSTMFFTLQRQGT
jgi:hypothetical protein